MPHEFSLDNGLKVLLVEKHALPVLTAEMVSRAGSENNPPRKGGLATLTAEIMGDGTESRSLEKLAQDQERIGTTHHRDAGMDAGTLSMTLLTYHLTRAWTCWRTWRSIRPSAPKTWSAAASSAWCASRRRLTTCSAWRFARGPKLVYGDQPYGTSRQRNDGEHDRADARRHRRISTEPLRSQATPRWCWLGDVTRAEPKSWPASTSARGRPQLPEPPAIPAPPAPQPTRVVIVDKPGAPQTALFMPSASAFRQLAGPPQRST